MQVRRSSSVRAAGKHEIEARYAGAHHPRSRRPHHRRAFLLWCRAGRLAPNDRLQGMRAVHRARRGSERPRTPDAWCC